MDQRDEVLAARVEHSAQVVEMSFQSVAVGPDQACTRQAVNGLAPVLLTAKVTFGNVSVAASHTVTHEVEIVGVVDGANAQKMNSAAKAHASRFIVMAPVFEAVAGFVLF